MKKLMCVILLLGITSVSLAETMPPGITKPLPESFPNLFQFTDTCNAFFLKHGSDALLINVGDGQVKDQLPKLGIDRVDKVLLSNHH